MARWEPPHPVAAALLDGALPWPPEHRPSALPRSPELAAALAACNARWENPVQRELEAWLAGAQVVVSGQQPGLWGGPLLSLVKACAVAAEVARLRKAGQSAVGFFWLETRDDDLAEMGWGRVAVGGELVEARESWSGGQACAFAALLSPLTSAPLQAIPNESLTAEGREALAWARACFVPGESLGQACGRFLAGLFRGSGVVLVDARLPELARASALAARELLARLDQAWDALERRGGELVGRGLPQPLRLRREQLPFFALEEGRRRRLPALAAASVAAELQLRPERFAPNVWARPLLQDAALGTAVAVLGSSELAYHWQAQELWELAGVSRPRWVLRPHLTVVGPAERRWAQKLGVLPEDLLAAHLPRRLIANSRLAQRLERATQRWLADFRRLAEEARRAYPNLAGDLEASEKRLAGSLAWLAQRVEARAEERLAVERQRFARLRCHLRPSGRPQERALSVLAPLLSLGAGFPAKLVEALELLPRDPNAMHLLFWRSGGLW